MIKINCNSRILKVGLVMAFLCGFSLKLSAETLADSAWSGSIEKVRQMIEQGHDVDAEGADNFTALIASAEIGNLELVKYLVSKGADVNAKNKYGANALHKVLDAERPGTKKLSKDRVQIATLLINSGTNVNAKGYNDTTALHIAVIRGDISVIKSLLDKGADPYAKTKKGRTPMYIAEILKNKAIIDVLKNYKQDKTSGISKQDSVVQNITSTKTQEIP